MTTSIPIHTSVHTVHVSERDRAAGDLTASEVRQVLAEEGRPRRFKAAYLSDHDIDDLVDRATYIRRPHLPVGPTDTGEHDSIGQGSREGWSA